MFRFVQVIIRL